MWSDSGIFECFGCSSKQTFRTAVSRGLGYRSALGDRAVGLKAWSVVSKSSNVKAFFLHSLPLGITWEDANCDRCSEGVRGDPLYTVKMARWKAEFSFSKQNGNLREGLQRKTTTEIRLLTVYYTFTVSIFDIFFTFTSRHFILIYENVRGWIYLSVICRGV